MLVPGCVCAIEHVALSACHQAWYQEWDGDGMGRNIVGWDGMAVHCCASSCRFGGRANRDVRVRALFVVTMFVSVFVFVTSRCAHETHHMS